MRKILTFDKWAITIVIKRLLFGYSKIEHWEDRYAKVKSNELDADEYVNNKAKKWRQTLDVVIKFTPNGGKILETGCGTSAMSIWLNKKGFNNVCIDNNDEILKIAKGLNEKSQTNVEYKKCELENLDFQDNTFDAVFSQGVLEHFDDDAIPQIINEGLRVGKTYIFAIPTICDVSTCLRGDENLMSYFKWKQIISKSNGEIVDVRGYFPFHPTIQKINSYFRNKAYWISPTIVFAIKKLDQFS